MDFLRQNIFLKMDQGRCARNQHNVGCTLEQPCEGDLSLCCGMESGDLGETLILREGRSGGERLCRKGPPRQVGYPVVSAEIENGSIGLFREVEAVLHGGDRSNGKGLLNLRERDVGEA